MLHLAEQLTGLSELVVLDAEASIGAREGLRAAGVTPSQEDSVLNPWLLASAAAVEADVGDLSLLALSEGSARCSLYASGDSGDKESDDAGELHVGGWLLMEAGCLELKCVVEE